MRAQVAHDVDPRVHRLHFKAAELAAPLNTFACVFKAWRDFKALNLKTGRQSTLSQIDRIFAQDVLPWLGRFSIFDIDNRGNQKRRSKMPELPMRDMELVSGAFGPVGVAIGAASGAAHTSGRR